MPIVFVCDTMRSMIADANQFINQNAEDISRINRKSTTIEIEFKSKHRFLFMTRNYYETNYKFGRRRGVDYERA